MLLNKTPSVLSSGQVKIAIVRIFEETNEAVTFHLHDGRNLNFLSISDLM